MSKNKILLIDDNAEMRDMLNDLLSFKGYDVATAENGIVGMDRLSDINPDLIICDIAMPDKDGFQVLEEVRASTQFATTPFVFLTASMLQSEEEKIINTSANGYLTKPYDSRQLFSLIDELLAEDKSD